MVRVVHHGDPMRARQASFLVCSIVVLTPLFAAACSSEQAQTQAETAAPGWAEAQNTSGSRLRAKVITGAGAREVVGFFDTLRKEDCTFRLADGKYRCLPEAAFQQFGGLFSDATCRTPLLSVPTCAADPKYLVTIGGVGCSSSVVTGVKRITGPAQTAFTNTGAGCGPASPTTTQLKGFVIGEDVSLNDFVDAVETPVANGALTETVLVASDGARQHLAYRIGALDAECTFQIMADGITRCVPRAQTSQIFYADADCAIPVRTTGGGSSGPCGSSSSDLVRENAPVGIGCSVAKNIFKIATGPTEGDDAGTSAITGDSSLYTASQSSTGPSCTSTQYWNRDYTRPIVNVTLTLPSTDRIGRGSGRLVPTLVTQQNSEELVAGWHDMERNVDCSFVKASDGKMRCLPTGPTGVVFFTDSACKAPTLVAVRGGPLSCAQAASKYVRATPGRSPTQPQSQCAPAADAITKVYELSGDVKNLGLSSFESAPGRCAQVQGVNGAVDAKEVDPALFVEGVLATE